MTAEHDSRCEREYTENGFIFIDCLCSLRNAKADAWDEGYYTGVRDELLERERAGNPYRDSGPTS